MPKPKLPPGVTIKGGRYYRVQYLGVVDGKRRQKWHMLSKVSEGLGALYAMLAAMSESPSGSDTAMPARIGLWLAHTLPGLSMSEQKEVERMAGTISDVFAHFHTHQVQAKHIFEFLNKWANAGKLRTAQRYRATFNKFFRWVIVQGDRQDNPVDPVSTKAPPPRTKYITDDEFMAIRHKLLGDDNHKAASGPMMQVYVDLLYLTGQSGNEIRTLRWSQIDEQAGVIRFVRSKVAKVANPNVEIPITAEIAAVLDRARAVIKKRQKGDVAQLTPYVVSNLDGSAYSAHGVGTAWERARDRAGITGCTLKDLRAKHATDAEKAGYSVEDIGQGLAHTDAGMTRVYLKQRTTKRAKVALKLPSD